MPLTLTEKIWVCKHASAPLKCEGAYSKMILTFHQFIWKIFLQGFSCYAPLNWQWLPWFTQQLNRPQRQSVWSLWETEDNSVAPSRSPVCVELKQPSLRCSWECAHLDSSCIVYSRLRFYFLVFGEGKVGKVKYLWMWLCVYCRFWVSVPVLSFFSLPSVCVHLQHPKQGGKLTPQQWPICLWVQREEEGWTLGW